MAPYMVSNSVGFRCVALHPVVAGGHDGQGCRVGPWSLWGVTGGCFLLVKGSGDMDLTRVVAVANGKGGVGKTSLVANLAGEFARAGSKVLVVDLDVSGNLKLDLGTVNHDGDDGGGSIFRGITEGSPLEVVKDVRPGIDWLPGGARLNWIVPMNYLPGASLAHGSVDDSWRQSLSDLIEAEGYDMVLLDCPPGSRELQQMALATARWVVVPMRSDPASWEGLQMLGPLVKSARQSNPDLAWLGMAVFGHQSTATRVLQTVKENLGDSELVLFNSTIRSSESTAQACRMRGMLVQELAASATTDPTERLKALRARRTDPSVVIPETVSPTSTSLADDYASLATEIATRILETEEAQR